ncbi:MAG TPA: hypothetical protein VJY65_03225 [Chloroflexota bacterium]|nr:hypothetical protein [Chloroflexota bacterium]
MDAQADDDSVGAIGAELLRIFGAASPESCAFMLLPLVGPVDALAFLRTVPVGTSFEQLLPLARTWWAAHPSPIGALYSADLDGWLT